METISIVSMFENRIESIDVTHARISAERVLDTRQGRARHTGRQDPVYHFG